MNEPRTSTSGSAPRRIRSFVRRAGRLTSGQQRALNELWPRWGVDDLNMLRDLDTLFGRSATRVLDIGFGDGEALLAMAEASPETDFLGVEVHAPGIGHCLIGAEAASVTNLRLIQEDAVDLLGVHLSPSSLDRTQLFFPDPWPKKRHHKRRIVQPKFLGFVCRVLKPGGTLHIATDWAPYAEHIQSVVADVSELKVTQYSGARPTTKFEERGRRLGHAIHDLVYQRA